MPLYYVTRSFQLGSDEFRAGEAIWVLADGETARDMSRVEAQVYPRTLAIQTFVERGALVLAEDEVYNPLAIRSFVERGALVLAEDEVSSGENPQPIPSPDPLDGPDFMAQPPLIPATIMGRERYGQRQVNAVTDPADPDFQVLSLTTPRHSLRFTGDGRIFLQDQLVGQDVPLVNALRWFLAESGLEIQEQRAPLKSPYRRALYGFGQRVLLGVGEEGCIVGSFRDVHAFRLTSPVGCQESPKVRALVQELLAGRYNPSWPNEILYLVRSDRTDTTALSALTESEVRPIPEEPSPQDPKPWHERMEEDS